MSCVQRGVGVNLHGSSGRNSQRSFAVSAPLLLFITFYPLIHCSVASCLSSLENFVLTPLMNFLTICFHSSRGFPALFLLRLIPMMSTSLMKKLNSAISFHPFHWSSFICTAACLENELFPERSVKRPLNQFCLCRDPFSHSRCIVLDLDFCF